MSLKLLLSLCLGTLAVMSGCTSFRTTSLFRYENDSLAPQKTSTPLKGLPVKMKVPSHVQVIVSEQQVILANSPEEISANEQQVKTTRVAVAHKQAEIEKLAATVSTARNKAIRLERSINYLNTRKTTDAGDLLAAINKLLRSELEDKTEADEALFAAEVQYAEAFPVLEVELAQLQAILTSTIRDATPNYTLVSFTPAQYVVETELEYTDKIFLVDFKRPLAGILDLKNAKLDDEQYFAQVQADLTERTLEDVSGALQTLTDPLQALRTSSNIAKPTSAKSSPTEVQADIHFQKSVVAIKRFDIGEAGWEDAMMTFVNERLAAPMLVP